MPMFDNYKHHEKRKNIFTLNRIEQLTKKLRDLSSHEPDWVLQKFHSTRRGLPEKYVEVNRSRYGINEIKSDRKAGVLKRLFFSFFNSFSLILITLAAASYFIDRFSGSNNGGFAASVVITVMIAVSAVMRFVQSTASGITQQKLSKFVEMYADIERRDEGRSEVLPEEIVAGDIIHLSAGDMIPCDVRIIRAKDFFVRQSTLSGEACEAEKTVYFKPGKNTAAADLKNIAFMGSTVLSGTAVAVAVAVGDDTIFGTASNMYESDEDEENQVAADACSPVSKVLVRLMAALVPLSLVFNGVTTSDWQGAILYAIALAVGLTPEMMPLIMTTCLSRGTVAMSEKKCIVKQPSALKNFAAMDTLCVDKTGTLTQNKAALSYHLDVHGNEEIRVLKHGFLNSFYQTSLKNLTDIEIINQAKELASSEPSLEGVFTDYIKEDEIPFDFTRRRMSVVVRDKSGKTQMITKGAVKQMLEISKFVEYKGKVEILTKELKDEILSTVHELNTKGLKVLAVAQKTNPSPVGAFSAADEADMVLIGYLAFLDPSRSSAAKELPRLNDNGVTVKVLTGDGESITKYICRQVGITYEKVLTGVQIDKLDDEQLGEICEGCNVFTELTPIQKARIIEVLQKNGHTVGCLGDSLNDSEALNMADVGISTCSAVDIAKENADIVLLDKSLRVLTDGLLQIRKTFVNISKYIKLTVSSNFGNMLSIMAASLLLPFLPMTSIQLLLLNLVYDISCTSIPWDNVDRELIHVPRLLSSRVLSKFMVWIGSASTIFDLLMFAVLYFVICPLMVTPDAPFTTYSELSGLFSGEALAACQEHYRAVFRAGWLIESIWTQIIALFVLRSPKPFKNPASAAMCTAAVSSLAAVTVTPFLKIGGRLGLAALPGEFFIWAAVLVFLYTLTLTIVKRAYIKHYGRLI